MISILIFSSIRRKYHAYTRYDNPLPYFEYSQQLHRGTWGSRVTNPSHSEQRKLSCWYPSQEGHQVNPNKNIFHWLNLYVVCGEAAQVRKQRSTSRVLNKSESRTSFTLSAPLASLQSFTVNYVMAKKCLYSVEVECRDRQIRDDRWYELCFQRVDLKIKFNAKDTPSYQDDYIPRSLRLITLISLQHWCRVSLISSHIRPRRMLPSDPRSVGLLSLFRNTLFRNRMVEILAAALSGRPVSRQVRYWFSINRQGTSGPFNIKHRKGVSYIYTCTMPRSSAP